MSVEAPPEASGGPLAGKRILVSGAGSGLGRAAARLFRQLGAEPVLLGRRLQALRETLPEARCEPLDHADPEAVAALAERCPTLDGMFLAAGQLWTGGAVDTPVEAFDRMIAANLKGPWLLCRHLSPRLVDGASVVLVGSNVGIRPIPDSAAYCVAKAGLHMLGRVLAQEWASRRIRVNVLAPGPVHTDMLEARMQASSDPAADLARLATVNPLGRLGSAAEIAQVGAFLLGDACPWMTGVILPVDGGAEGVL